jgi:hypothetical protein
MYGQRGLPGNDFFIMVEDVQELVDAPGKQLTPSIPEVINYLKIFT